MIPQTVLEVYIYIIYMLTLYPRHVTLIWNYSRDPNIPLFIPQAIIVVINHEYVQLIFI